MSRNSESITGHLMKSLSNTKFVLSPFTLHTSENTDKHGLFVPVKCEGNFYQLFFENEMEQKNCSDISLKTTVPFQKRTVPLKKT